MKICCISLYRSPVKLYKPFVISLGPLTHARNLLVRIEAADGTYGWGEASPFPTIHGETMESALVMARDLGSLLLGHDANDIAGANRKMRTLLYGNNCVKSAFDIALHDLAGKRAGVPVYELLGGRRNPRTLRTDYTVSLAPVAEMVAAALDLRRRRFPFIKLKLGGGGAEDVGRVEAIRAAIGPDIPLRLDANQGWTVPEAITVLRAVEGANIQHCEAPIDRRDWHRLAEIRSATRVPIFADESCWDSADAHRLLDAGAVDGINIKLSKSGGLQEAAQIVALAEERRVPLQIGGFLESRLGFTAAAHLALTSSAVHYVDFDTPMMQEEDPVIGGITYGPDWQIYVPSTPGLGVAIDPDYLNQLEGVRIS